MRDETVTVEHGELITEAQIYNSGQIQCPHDGCRKGLKTVSGVKQHLTQIHDIRANTTCTCVVCGETFTNTNPSRDRKSCSPACGAFYARQFVDDHRGCTQ